ncbi:imelysin family protein [Salinisphaera sp.]|uniref:imelysin family protein n=1 Tax=Salinisphaera sp. TaxID=1914330 RepID=UPI002D792829|nr:imelysin family protein [Salinisphaera sp.]HET7315088.1 imelysin family protein [Salinisphaera sp.]
MAQAAPADYKPMAEYWASRAVAGAEQLEQALQSGNGVRAQRAWNAMRPAYEHCETFSGTMFPKADTAIDQHPVGAPAKAGEHAIERLLFAGGAAQSADFERAEALAAAVTKQAKQFRTAIEQTDFNAHAQTLMNGLTGLAHELGHAKMAYPESPFSNTSLRDYRNNIIAIQETYALAFRPQLQQENGALDQAITADIIRLAGVLNAASGYARLDKAAARQASTALVADLQEAAGQLGLQPAELEE